MGVSNRTRKSGGVWVDAGERTSLLDVAAVLAVPAATVAAFLLPRSVRSAFVLSYLDPTPVTMYASHFVHLGPTHLVTNLVVYLAVVPLTLLLSLLSDRRQRFYVAFFTILVAFPFVLSALNVALARPRVGFGLSGINMAFLGFLPLALREYLSSRYTELFRPEHAPLLFFVGTAIISLWGVPRTTTTLLTGSASLLVCLLYARSITDEFPGSATAVVHRTLDEFEGVELALVAVSLSVLLPFAAFPPMMGSEAQILNVYTHLLGYSLGFIVPYVTFWLVAMGASDE